VLGIGVAGQVRLGEDDEAGDAAGRRKDVEPRLSDGMEVEVVDDSVEERAQDRGIRQRIRRTARGVDEPLRADFHRLARL